MDMGVKQVRPLKWPLFIALLAVLFPLFQRFVMLPFYLSTGGDAWLVAQLNRLASMVVLPGKVVAYRLIPPREHYFGTPQLLLASAFNLVIYIIIAYMLLRIFRRIYLAESPDAATAAIPDNNTEAPEPDSENPPSPDRRKFLFTAGTSALGLTIIAAGAYPVFVAPNRLKVRRLTLALKDLPAALNGITIAQLTDFHHDEWISLEHIRQAVQITNALKPDLVALTGDYVTSNPALIRPAVQEFSRLRPRIGTVAVLGNHDWWSDVDESRKQIAAIDVPLIDNSRLFLTTDRRIEKSADAGLCLAGVGDLWEDEVDPMAALHKVPVAMPRVLLSHNPDVAEQDPLLSSQQRVDVILSGHTHGGQVRLPGIGTPIVPSAYGSKYAQGLVQGPHCPVQVSAGIGLALLPVRVNVRPEIVLITLQTANKVG